MTLTQQAQHYTRLNFALVLLPLGSKAPKGRGWPNRTVTQAEHAAIMFAAQKNIGLEHGQSETGTLDIDSLDDARIAFDFVGLELDKVLAQPTVSIRGKNAAKPLYEMRGLALPYFKLTWPHPSEQHPNGKPKHYTVFELRTGAGKQDLLPPSKHPEGMTYQWEPDAPQTRADLLTPPRELLELWRDPERLALLREACPWREVEAVPNHSKRAVKFTPPGESVIAAFNAANSVRDLLERYGYRYSGYDRYLPPESSTGIAGAVVYTGQDGLERVVVHNASSPLCQLDAMGVTRGVDAFGVWLEYEHGGDLTAAVRAVARELGMGFDEQGSSVNLSRWISQSWHLPNNKTHTAAWTVKSPWES